MSKSKKNRTIRHNLERIFGKGCMFQKAYIAEKIEQIGGIKTYKQFIQEKHYTLKEIKRLEANITLHHLRHRSEGGPTTEENSANINELAHRYAHSLPRHQEEIINNMLRDYKHVTRRDQSQYDLVPVKLEDEIDIDFEIKMAEMSFSDEIGLDMRPIKKKFNRAKENRQFQRRIKEDLEEEEYDR